MTHEFRTEKGEFLAKNIPETTYQLEVKGNDLWVYYTIDNQKLVFTIDISNYELICATKDATEEQAKEIVEAKHNLKYADRKDMTGYRDYGEPHKDGNPYWLGNASEALLSLLEREKLYRVNPFKEPKYKDFYFGYLEDFDRWQQLEERVGNWVILRKLP